MLTDLQSDILKLLARNRSDTSYVAGGIALNVEWPRLSDDIDIFHDTDEEIVQSAERDIATLREAGMRVDTDIRIYGLVEATVTRGRESTLIQWMSETRSRFFPLVRDELWGARLHRADLAVNKIIAASSRSKARDLVDLAMIAEHYCPLGPLLLAAAGKPPNFSPLRMIEEIRRRAVSIPGPELESVRGLPADWTAASIRERLAAALDRAETYVRAAPLELSGVLALLDDVPAELDGPRGKGLQLRRVTSEPDALPSFPDASLNWKSD